MSPTIGNLDKNLFIQYFDYLSGILQGDFGPSYNYRDFSVADLSIKNKLILLL